MHLGVALLRAKAAIGKLSDENEDVQSGINIVLNDHEGVALDAFDLEPILAPTGAIRQVDAFRDDALKLMRGGDLEDSAPSPSNSSLNRMAPLFGRPINCSSASRRSVRGRPRRSRPSRERQS